MTRLAVFASGTGSNFQAIQESIERGDLVATIVLLVTDRPDAPVVQKAHAYGIPVFAFHPRRYPDKSSYETDILRRLEATNVEWIVLAGYMRILGTTLLTAYPRRIINIHPSLLPAFPGLDAIGQALSAGVTTTGVTIHYVDAGIDTGEIIAQESITIPSPPSRSTLEAAIHAIEHRLYPTTIARLIKEDL
jgi:phosphoribosylglycinamide formyltransferase-1